MMLLIPFILGAISLAWGGQAQTNQALLHSERQFASDLEVAGDLPGLNGRERYICYRDLLKLPQVSYTISDDSNFPPNTTVSGVALDELVRSFGGAPASDLVIALCSDKYRATYSRAYISAHHPILVLRVNGSPPEMWPKVHGTEALGPYLISHPAFTPTFRVLSHEDERQIPFGVVRLEIRSETVVFGAIAPHGDFHGDSAVTAGYRIAQQNCYRCHNMGLQGGHLARRPWQVLGAIALSAPDYFRRYVRDPQAIDAANKMPGNPQYDDATIEALRRYFATFAMKGDQ